MIATLALCPRTDSRLKARGVYVARHASQDLYTLGRADRMSIRDRLKRHAVQYDGPDYEYDRHRYHPFTDLAFAILMEDCRPIDVELAEHALYTAVAAEYPFVATSVFAAPHTSDLEGVRERLFDHLQAMSVVSNPDELN